MMMQTAPSLLRQGPGVLPNVGVNITVVGDPGTATVEVLAAKGFLLHGPSANRRVAIFWIILIESSIRTRRGRRRRAIETTALVLTAPRLFGCVESPHVAVAVVTSDVVVAAAVLPLLIGPIGHRVNFQAAVAAAGLVLLFAAVGLLGSRPAPLPIGEAGCAVVASFSFCVAAEVLLWSRPQDLPLLKASLAVKGLTAAEVFVGTAPHLLQRGPGCGEVRQLILAVVKLAVALLLMVPAPFLFRCVPGRFPVLKAQVTVEELLAALVLVGAAPVLLFGAPIDVLASTTMAVERHFFRAALTMVPATPVLVRLRPQVWRPVAVVELTALLLVVTAPDLLLG
mmetsp:Transcript_37064/g.86963  ORF Transcript_37064/g.86963 Transcript_37064/m.86963 type:complete len:340 (-) Transcript_37064:959-1978(-)